MHPRHLPVSALGAAIRAQREARGLAQAALAARSGLHASYIDGVERGERNASWNALVALASGLDMPLSQLVADAEALGSQEA